MKVNLCAIERFKNISVFLQNLSQSSLVFGKFAMLWAVLKTKSSTC